jgi:hypothetical protein
VKIAFGDTIVATSAPLPSRHRVSMLYFLP